MTMNKIYIVCTGTSLQGFNFAPLEFYNTIAVNFAYRYFTPKHIVGLDKEFWNQATDLPPAQYHSVKGYNKDQSYAERLGVKLWPSRRYEGWDKYPYVSHGYNSAHAALHIAIHLGYKDIRILGMDLTWGHFYDPYITKPPDKDSYEHVIKKFKLFKSHMPQTINVNNYSINSLCPVFTLKELKDWNE